MSVFLWGVPPMKNRGRVLQGYASLRFFFEDKSEKRTNPSNRKRSTTFTIIASEKLDDVFNLQLLTVPKLFIRLY
jgi:hypothetical protein